MPLNVSFYFCLISQCKKQINFCRVLYINSNKLLKIDNAISRLQNLISLDLSRNPLDLPVYAISRLVYLKELRLYDVSLLHFPADFCRTMVHLKLLGLSHNQLTDLPYELNRLRELEEIFLENNCLEDFPLPLFDLPKLKVSVVEMKYVVVFHYKMCQQYFS